MKSCWRICLVLTIAAILGSLVLFRSTAQNYRVTDLTATLGTNASSYGHAINNLSDAVGYFVSSTNTNVVRGFLYSGGSLLDLGAIGATNSMALGLNSRGQSVGFTQDMNGPRSF